MERVMQGRKLCELLGIHRTTLFKWVRNAGLSQSGEWRRKNPTVGKMWDIDSEILPSVPTFGAALSVEVAVGGKVYLTEAQYERLNAGQAFDKPGGDQIEVILVPE